MGTLWLLSVAGRGEVLVMGRQWPPQRNERGGARLGPRQEYLGVDALGVDQDVVREGVRANRDGAALLGGNRESQQQFERLAAAIAGHGDVGAEAVDHQAAL